MKMEKILKLFLGLILVLSLVACSNELEEINIEAKSEIFVNENFAIITNIEVEEYKTAQNTIIDITEFGVVTGLNKGNATIIIVFVDGREKQISLEVKEREEIVINGEEIIAIGESFKFTSNIQITNIQVSNDIVEVLSNNTIKGVKSGFALLTITFIDERVLQREVQVLEDIIIQDSKSIIVDSTFEVISNIEIKNITASNDVVEILENNIIKGIKSGVSTLTITFVDERIREITVSVNNEIIINSKDEIYVGEEFKLETNQEVKEYIYDDSYLSINQLGVVKGLKEGNQEIKLVFIDEQIKTINIIILGQIDIINNIKTEMIEGEKYDIEANLQIVSFASNNENLAVSADGHVLAKKAGEAIITIIYIDGRDLSYSVVINENINYEYYHTKVLSFDTDNNYIELLDVPVTRYDEDLIVEKLINGEIESASINDLYLGMENIYARVNSYTNIIEKLLIEGEIGFSNIRVGIRKSIGDISDDSTLFHDLIKFTTSSTTVFKTFDNELSEIILSDKQVEVEYFNGKIEIYVDGLLIATTEKRVLFVPDDNTSEMTITSISRSQGNPSYSGNFEISIVNNRLLLINDVSLENYLTKVIPSEMPTSYHIEALKAQSIAARTYAYADILNKSTSFYGYSVDDSVKSQVYNNNSAQIRGNEAVFATSGKIMMSGEELVQAFYYSTSSGLTGSASEIWFNGEVPYLIGQNLSTDDLGNEFFVDPTSEASMLNFFKTIKVHHPDESMTMHRWKVTFTKTAIAKTLNVFIQSMRNSSPKDFLTKLNDTWIEKDIPNDIGSVIDMYVEKRGTSGVVMELVIETTTGIYKIINQYNIRFTIRPRTAGSTMYYARSSDSGFTNRLNNDTTLPSGFFAIEKINDEFVVYGGGYGHGVGMSQNGANYLGKNGKNFQEILITYYSNVSIIDKSYNYIPIVDYKDYLK